MGSYRGCCECLTPFVCFRGCLYPPYLSVYCLPSLCLQALEVYELFLFLASVLTRATFDSVALKSPIFILKAFKQASFTISVQRLLPLLS